MLTFCLYNVMDISFLLMKRVNYHVMWKYKGSCLNVAFKKT